MKRKGRPTHGDSITASESVKTRPRKKLGASASTPTSQVQRKDVPTSSSKLRNDQKTAPAKKFTRRLLNPKQEDSDMSLVGLLPTLAPAHLVELAEIWNSDNRMPTPESRRAWALARKLKAEMVHRWFYRRKQLAKKANIQLPREKYALPVGTPPVIEVVFTKEEPACDDDGPTMQLRQDSVKVQQIGRSSASPATTLRDLTNMDSDCLTLRSSSPFEERPHNRRAYTRSSSSAPSSLPSSSPPPPSSPLSCSPASSPCPGFPLFLRTVTSASSADEEDADARQVWCNQNNSEQVSEYTCCLCASPFQLDSGSTHLSTFFNPYTNFPCDAIENQPLEYIPLPLTPDSLLLMQLSAIPFLSRSPDLLTTPPTDNSCCAQQICLGGNTYAHDGSFIARCLRPSVSSAAHGDQEVMEFTVHGKVVGVDFLEEMMDFDGLAL